VGPVFEHALHRYRVYAPDLPGFGFSDRSARSYNIGLYVDAILDMLDVIEAQHGRSPVDALALSLSCEFLARVVTQQPYRFRTLALVSPTGLARGDSKRHPARDGSRELAGLHALVSFPLWSQALYDLIVSGPSIRYFLERTYGSREIDQALVDYDYVTSHQPGAKNAPLAFLSGRLFSADIRATYEQLVLPVWMPHGTRGDFRDFSAALLLRERANWTLQSFDSGALPHFEQRAQFNAAFERFLDRA
jgi:pimeloyl-ACP methyl ester carboxylesterase